MGIIHVLDWLNRVCSAAFLPCCAWILLSGLDDLFITVVWLWSLFADRRSRRQTPAATTERPIAVFVPLWREHRVVSQMITGNLRAIRYTNYHFFIGVYPNDEPTLQAVRDLELRYPRVHLAVVGRPGPSSKGDCLNHIHGHMVRYEQRHRIRFEIIMMHDAEDVIHPSSLALVNRYSTRYDMIQVPVLPLPTPVTLFTHGVYCDEFAEYQCKDITVRQMLGGFLASNGVGTGFVRDALDRLAEHEGSIFNSGSLTEDYEIGYRLHRLGCRQKFLPIRFEDGDPVATREYFPSTLSRAIRQRTRWITGICLQGWQHNGWGRGPAEFYWFWRDRKGLAGNLITIVANLLFAYGLLSLAGSRLAGVPWHLGSMISDTTLTAAVALSLCFQSVSMLSRAVLVARIFGWRLGITSPARTIWANAINCTATVLAVRDYARSRWTGQRVFWRKTDHSYPMKEVTIETGWLLPRDVDPHAAHALPAHILRRWRVLPFRVSSGNLFLASPGLPDESIRAEVARFTRLEIHVRRVSAENYRQLVDRLL